MPEDNPILSLLLTQQIDAERDRIVALCNRLALQLHSRQDSVSAIVVEKMAKLFAGNEHRK